jgi:starch-binding outer membrane protein, SusD/RagB family
VNLVRTRAGMPNVNDKFTGSKENFRERIRNERSVELIFEAKRRDDLRRWHIAHLDKYKDLYGCAFPQDHSYFNNRDYVKSIVFEEKHYWFPFPKSQVTLYEGWKQNPGW